MATVLVVDDSAVERKRVGRLLEKGTGRADPADGEPLAAVAVADGMAALDALSNAAPEVVLTDLLMPEMSGLKLVEEVRARWPGLPVILMTSHGSEEIACAALQRGAACYVPKRNLARDLVPTIDKILALTRAAQEQQRVLGSQTRSERVFVLDNDRAFITPVVRHLQDGMVRWGVCDEADALRVTIALHEALVNAMEHGNLGVSSELRENDESAYHAQVKERRNQPPYRDRRVTVVVRESPGEVVYVVRDEGAGFKPGDLPDPLDPANLEKSSGRGLLLIRTFMDDVRHNDTGNEITMTKRRAAEPAG